MRFEDFKAALLFSFVGVLVGKKLLQQPGVIGVSVSHGGVFENDCGAIVPAAIFSGVITWSIREHLQDAAHLDFFLQHGIMVFLEERDEFICMSPFGFVVVLDHIRFILLVFG